MGTHIHFFRMGLQNPTVNSCFGGMYRSFFKALCEAGHVVTFSDDRPDTAADLLVAPAGSGQELTSAKAMQACNCPVILYVPPAAVWFRQNFLKRWQDRILFVYGTDRSSFSHAAYQRLGITYHHVPFASDPEIMTPLHLPRHYDILFVGNAGSGSGRDRYITSLMQRMKHRRIMLLGSGWEAYGFPRQLVGWGNLLNLLYNHAQICINLANDEQQLGNNSRLDANNRLFDLAMAGCFQISNAPEIVSSYFKDSEVVSAATPEEWLESINYFLEHPDEAEPYRKEAREKALAEHCWCHRATVFSRYITEHLNQYQRKPAGPVVQLLRQRDIWFKP